MSKTSKGWLILALAGAVGIAYLVLGDLSSERPAEEQPPREARMTLAGPEGHGPALAGTVLSDLGDEPIPGALIYIERRDRSGVPVIARSDGEGRFQSDRLRPGRYRVSASRKGFTPDTIELEISGEGSDVVLRLAEGGATLVGTVADISGGPVAGAVVRADPGHAIAESDRDGAYAMTLASGLYRITVEHPEYATAVRPLAIRDRAELNVGLVPGSTVEGLVVDALGRPVEGAVVTASGAVNRTPLRRPHRAHTETDGRFILRGLPPGQVQIAAAGRGLVSAEDTIIDLTIAEHLRGLVLVVSEGRSIAGRVVVRGTDQSVAGAIVSATSMTDFSRRVSAAPSDESGAFELQALPPGDYLLTSENPFDASPQALRLGAEDLRGLKVEVVETVTLAGRVEPPVAASITVEPVGSGSLLDPLMAARTGGLGARTDADGRFRIEAVPLGRHRLQALADDGRAGSLNAMVNDGAEDHIIELEDRGSIAGRVVDEGGNAAAGVQIVWGAANVKDLSMGGERQLTDVEGAFELPGLADGDYRIEVHGATGQLAWRDRKPENVAVEQRIENAQRIEGLELVIERADGNLRVVVRGSDGAPAADVWVRAVMEAPLPAGLDTEDEDERIPVWAPNEGEPVLSDQGGQADLRGLRAGRYYVEASDPKSGARAMKSRVALGAEVELVLEPRASVVGTLTAAGAAVEQFEIELVGPVRRHQRVSSSTGRFEVRRLDPGRYTLRLFADGGTASKTVELEAGRATTVDAELEAWASLSGRLVDGGTGAPIEGVHVVVMANSQSVRDVASIVLSLTSKNAIRTDARGRFQIDRLQVRPIAVMFMRLAEDGELEGSSVVALRRISLEPGKKHDLGTVEDIEGARKKRHDAVNKIYEGARRYYETDD